MEVMLVTAKRIDLIFVAIALYHFVFAGVAIIAPSFLYSLVACSEFWPSTLTRAIGISVALLGVVAVYGYRHPTSRRLCAGILLLAKLPPPLFWLTGILFSFAPRCAWPFVLFDDVIWWVPLWVIIRLEKPSIRSSLHT